jgi:hypothetical protein
MTRTFEKDKPVGVAAEARKHNPAWEPFDLIINTELPGVLNWALAGLKRALERGHFINTEAGKDLLEQSRKESNVVAAFVEECVTHDLTVMMTTTDFHAAFKEWWISEHGEKAAVPSPTHVGLELAALPKLRIAQNKDKFKLATGQRFYLGCYLNVIGEEFWKDAANSARLLKPQSRLAEQSKPYKDPVPSKWKNCEEYRRIETNTERFREQEQELQQADHNVADATEIVEVARKVASKVAEARSAFKKRFTRDVARLHTPALADCLDRATNDYRFATATGDVSKMSRAGERLCEVYRTVEIALDEAVFNRG